MGNAPSDSDSDKGKDQAQSGVKTKVKRRKVRRQRVIRTRNYTARNFRRELISAEVQCHISKRTKTAEALREALLDDLSDMDTALEGQKPRPLDMDFKSVEGLQWLFDERPQLRARGIVYTDEPWLRVARTLGKAELQEEEAKFEQLRARILNREELQEEETKARRLRARIRAVVADGSEEGEVARPFLHMLVFAGVIGVQRHIMPLVEQITEGDEPEDFNDENELFSQVDDIVSMLNSSELFKELQRPEPRVNLDDLLNLELHSLRYIENYLQVVTKPELAVWYHLGIYSVTELLAMQLPSRRHILEGLGKQVEGLDLSDACTRRTVRILAEMSYALYGSMVEHAKTQKEKREAQRVESGLDYSTLPVVTVESRTSPEGLVVTKHLQPASVLFDWMESLGSMVKKRPDAL